MYIIILQNIGLFFLGDCIYLDGNFRKSIWPILFIGQILGLMPVIGISQQSISDLKFNWKSRRTLYGFIVAVIATFYASMHVYRTLIVEIDFYLIGLLLTMKIISDNFTSNRQICFSEFDIFYNKRIWMYQFFCASNKMA